MDTIIYLAPAVSVFMALIAVLLISGRLVAPVTHGRFYTIDGLRGYLAFFVFLHHCSIWYYYLKTGVWELPPSRLFVHFGQVGVALFFMITGFLFFSKLLDDRKTGVDWVRIYVSRVLRLTPLYLFSMVILLSIVVAVTWGESTAPLTDNIVSVFKWLTFTIAGRPDINGMHQTFLINAGVAWSLPYEWMFYFALPMIAVFTGMKVPKLLVLISVVLVSLLGIRYFKDLLFMLFVGGIIAVLLVRVDRFKAFAESGLASVLVALFLIVVIGFYDQLYGEFVPQLMLVAVFCLVAGGNTFFGVLKAKVSRSFGELAYGIYLLHGILLFVTFKFVIGYSVAKDLSPLQFWMVIFAITPILVVVCGFTFKLIEKPAMGYVGTVTEWIKLRSVQGRIAEQK